MDDSYFEPRVSRYTDSFQLTLPLHRGAAEALFRPYTHTLGRIFKGGRFFQGGDIFSLAVFAIPYYMATLARCAPLSNSNELVDSPQMQKITQTSRSLVEKIRLSIPDTHASCIRSEVSGGCVLFGIRPKGFYTLFGGFWVMTPDRTSRQECKRVYLWLN